MVVNTVLTESLTKSIRNVRRFPATMSHMKTYGYNNYGSAAAGSSPAADYGELQHLVDALYREVGPRGSVSRIDVIMRAEIDDLSDDLREVIDLLPAGSYRRSRLCDQLNSIITAHGWGYVYGTVE